MKAKIVVLGNEKGGTGKSTLAMHLIVTWLREGKKVAAVDLDGRQGTLSRYLQNRKEFATKNGVTLPMPDYVRMNNISNEILFLRSQLERLSNDYDIIVLDTPGADTALTQEALFQADTLITPISDSLIDLNVLADIDFENEKIGQPGHYANYIWEVKKYLASLGKPYLNWIVVGNKLSSYNSRNKQTVFSYLEKMSKLYGFRLAEIIKDRVIYRELFLEGLTVLDMQHPDLRFKMSVSHIAAKREIRALAEFICPE